MSADPTEQTFVKKIIIGTPVRKVTGAQAQTGETMRTMLRNNPYSGSVMQAPNISF